MGLLFALSLPGLVVLLVVLAAVERLGRWGGSRNWLPWRRRADPAGAPLAGTGLEELHAMLSGAKRLEVEQRAAISMMRDDQADGAPPLPAGLRAGQARREGAGLAARGHAELAQDG